LGTLLRQNFDAVTSTDDWKRISADFGTQLCEIVVNLDNVSGLLQLAWLLGLDRLAAKVGTFLQRHFATVSATEEWKLMAAALGAQPGFVDFIFCLNNGVALNKEVPPREFGGGGFTGGGFGSREFDDGPGFGNREFDDGPGFYSGYHFGRSKMAAS
jgi:hypothetical protein